MGWTIPGVIAGLDTREKETTTRELIGPDSWDALALAHYRSVPLYADDLGLRRLEHRGSLVRSFSTATLLLSLAAGSSLSATERDHRLHDLARRKYLVLPVTPEFLVSAVKRGSEFPPSDLQLVFNALGTLNEAALVAAKTFMLVATQVLQLQPLPRVVDLVLNGMSATWPPFLVVQAVRQGATERFWLIPNRFSEIEQTCAVFALGVLHKPILSPS